MDYIQKLSDYFDGIIKSKKIEIPDTNIANAVRRQQFTDNCKVMTTKLDEIFAKQINDTQDQANKAGQYLDTQKISKIGQTKIKDFVQKSIDESGIEI